MVEEHKNESTDELFNKLRPECMDVLFIKYQDIVIIPGQRAQNESYLTKVSTTALQVSNVVAIMTDASEEHTFKSFEIYGVGVVVDVNACQSRGGRVTDIHCVVQCGSSVCLQCVWCKGLAKDVW